MYNVADHLLYFVHHFEINIINTRLLVAVIAWGWRTCDFELITLKTFNKRGVGRSQLVCLLFL